MSNISPGFSARFARIELEPTGAERPMRKQYPASMYPGTHAANTPSACPPPTTTPLAPRLSTAARAQTRLASHTKAPVPSPATLKRILPPASNDDRAGPAAALAGRPALSFMRETSSLRKKQAPVAPQTRLASHPDVHARRKHHYAVLATKKRARQGPLLLDSAAAPSPESPGSSRAPKLAVLADNSAGFGGPRLAGAASRSASPGAPPTTAENVYTRLYAGLKKARPAERARHTHTAAARVGTRPRSRTPSATRLDMVSTDKPASAAQMYALIHRRDASLFTDPNSLDVPLTARDPLSVELIDQNLLSVYERGELMRHAQVYFTPKAAAGTGGASNSGSSSGINVSNFKNNYGFDDLDGNYLVRAQDHIAYRYEIVRVLGTGSFGNVVHCRDHKYTLRGHIRNVAVKLIKNELDWSLQAVSEIKMLKHLAAALQGHANAFVMNYLDHFHFRGHMCIVSEYLSLNLYTFLEIGGFRGVAFLLLRSFCRNILLGLRFIHAQRVIHCDIKPENIMIKLPPDYNPGDETVLGFEVKLIDFGSSCFENEMSFSYIQSRFYRAPEVILGARYSYEIDVWSFGCVVAELFTGSPLLPGRNEIEQIALVLEMFGPPPSTFVLAERKRLLRYMKIDSYHKLNDPLVSGTMFSGRPSMQVDDKKLKKTLLYTLFNLDGKINSQFLNMQLQACEARDHHSGQTSTFKRSIKISSRSLDVAMRLHSSHEDKADQNSFSRFMALIFQWNPAARTTADQLLDSPFLQDND